MGRRADVDGQVPPMEAQAERDVELAERMAMLGASRNLRRGALLLGGLGLILGLFGAARPGAAIVLFALLFALSEAEVPVAKRAGDREAVSLRVSGFRVLYMLLLTMAAPAFPVAWVYPALVGLTLVGSVGFVNTGALVILAVLSGLAVATTGLVAAIGGYTAWWGATPDAVLDPRQALPIGLVVMPLAALTVYLRERAADTGLSRLRRALDDFRRADRERVEAEEEAAAAATRAAEAERLSQIDDGSGLFDKGYFHELLLAGGPGVSGRPGETAILSMDLDKLKQANDDYGHEAGDELIHAIAGVLRLAAEPDGVAARVGGDEFAILLPARGLEHAEEVAAGIHARLADTRLSFDRNFPARVSIGIAVAPHHGDPLDQVLAAADAAQYVAKMAGGGVTRVAAGEEGPQGGGARGRLVEELARALLAGATPGERDVLQQAQRWIGAAIRRADLAEEPAARLRLLTAFACTAHVASPAAGADRTIALEMVHEFHDAHRVPGEWGAPPAEITAVVAAGAQAYVVGGERPDVVAARVDQAVAGADPLGVWGALSATIRETV